MNPSSSAEGELLWTPSAEAANGSRMAHYLRWLNARRAHARQPALASYAELWSFSVNELEEFWGSLWDYFELGPRTFSRVLEHYEMPGARWFPGATLNYTSRLLRQRPDAIAVIHHDERGRQALLTYGELWCRVAGCQATLRDLGVKRGDRVVGYVTNAPEALIAFLATASLGAIWSSCPPEFGVESVLDRFSQISPKVLFACAGYEYGGKHFDRRADVARLRTALPSLETCIWVGEPRAGQGAALGQGELSFADIAPRDEPFEIEQVPFDHPLWILFSSGTTGLPKPIVHGHGGILLEHLKVLALHSDLGVGDRFFWFSTTGWMMWNYLIGGLQLGVTVVLYDGSPGYPDLSRLWRLAAEERVTYFGASAPFLMACRAAGLVPREAFDLSALRAVGSTGAPLPVAGFDWVYQCVKSDVLLASVRGHRSLYRIRGLMPALAGARRRAAMPLPRRRRAGVR
jgi:acetoacetyl-CoA synthetase